jgi:hypothetical protein
MSACAMASPPAISDAAVKKAAAIHPAVTVLVVEIEHALIDVGLGQGWDIRQWDVQIQDQSLPASSWFAGVHVVCSYEC